MTCDSHGVDASQRGSEASTAFMSSIQRCFQESSILPLSASVSAAFSQSTYANVRPKLWSGCTGLRHEKMTDTDMPLNDSFEMGFNRFSIKLSAPSMNALLSTASFDSSTRREISSRASSTMTMRCPPLFLLTSANSRSNIGPNLCSPLSSRLNSCSSPRSPLLQNIPNSDFAMFTS